MGLLPSNQQPFADAMAQRARRQAMLNTTQGSPYEATLASSVNATPEWDSYFGALNREKQDAGAAGMRFGVNYNGVGNTGPSLSPAASLAGFKRAYGLL